MAYLLSNKKNFGLTLINNNGTKKLFNGMARRLSYDRDGNLKTMQMVL